MGTVESVETVETQVTGAAAHIIKRPRLTKILDETDARIILLCAPAGYGKTTLAREWVATRSEPVYWYSGGPQMADVAALAVELAELVTGDDSDVTAGVRALASRGETPRVLAKTLAKVLTRRERRVLVIDDLQHALASPEADEFLRDLVALSAARFLLTSRDRPSWVDGRKRAYGEALVVDHGALAFTATEAEAVLPHNERVRDQAGGWPAVVGLAALSVDLDADQELPPERLYEYIAAELVGAIEPPLRLALYRLALEGDVSAAVTRTLLGDATDEILEHALRTGLVDRQASEWVTMHPLLRTFLVDRVRGLAPGERDALVEEAFDALTSHREWDAGLNVLKAFPVEAHATRILEAALPQLLDAGRTSTVVKWVDLAMAARFQHAVFLLANSEVALRQGRDSEAQAIAEEAARSLAGDLAARAHLTAARAAHQTDSWMDANRNIERARELATSAELQTEALWLAYANAHERNPSEAHIALERLEALDDPRPQYAVRLACGRTFQLMMESEGNLRDALAMAERAVALAATIQDPLLSTNALNLRAHLLRMCGRYEETLNALPALLDVANRTGLEFVIDHARLAQAGAFIGLRALGSARDILRALRLRNDVTDHVRGNATMLVAKLQTAAGDLPGALQALEQLPPRQAIAQQSELLALRGLLQVASGDLVAARSTLARITSPLQYVDAAAEVRLAHELIRMKRDGPAPTRTASVVRGALEKGCVDVVVTAFRADATLARAAVEGGLTHELEAVLTASNDFSLGRHVGLAMPRQLRRGTLSPREEEVFELVVAGRSNPEIAKTLFISESTAKVHIKHIFEKLGVHSRAEAVAVGRKISRGAGT